MSKKKTKLYQLRPFFCDKNNKKSPEIHLYGTSYNARIHSYIYIYQNPIQYDIQNKSSMLNARCDGND